MPPSGCDKSTVWTVPRSPSVAPQPLDCDKRPQIWWADRQREARDVRELMCRMRVDVPCTGRRAVYGPAGLQRDQHGEREPVVLGADRHLTVILLRDVTDRLDAEAV